jgi:DNA (cytosine-5)-methyltransferase 1
VKPRALDLFCKAGGASMGLHRAGFEVVGVDIEPQPRYPFEFHQANALTYPLHGFDFIWASPVCKRWTDGATARMVNGGFEYPNQIAPIRARLEERGGLWAIENVIRAPIRADIILHGHMFGLKVIRRRKFELSWDAFDLVPPLPRGLLREGFVCAVGNGTPSGVREMGLENYTVARVRDAMGIDWMNRDELSQAIPPAYGEYIGRAAMAALTKRPDEENVQEDQRG